MLFHFLYFLCYTPAEKPCRRQVTPLMYVARRQVLACLNQEFLGETALSTDPNRLQTMKQSAETGLNYLIPKKMPDVVKKIPTEQQYEIFFVNCGG